MFNVYFFRLIQLQILKKKLWQSEQIYQNGIRVGLGLIYVVFFLEVCILDTDRIIDTGQ